jgi:transitional endoplasmic reticulum ATPase
MSKFYGESEERLREMFRQAQGAAPSILFIDELDSVAPKREEVVGDVEKRIVSQLLTLMDGIQSRGNLVVIGATNRPDIIDEALLRPGRFDRILEVPAPDAQARKEILKIQTAKKPLDASVSLDTPVEMTDGMTGADIAAVVNAAAMAAIKEQISAGSKGRVRIAKGHFEKALQKVRRRGDAVREILA